MAVDICRSAHLLLVVAHGILLVEPADENVVSALELLHG